MSSSNLGKTTQMIHNGFTFKTTNFVAISDPTGVPENFHFMMRFLLRGKLKFALTHSSPIMAGVIEQFWDSAEVVYYKEHPQHVQKIEFSMNEKRYKFSTSHINKALHFPKTRDVFTPSEQELKSMLTFMKYETDNIDKLLFSRVNRGSLIKEWNYFFYTLLTSMTGKCSAWDQIPKSCLQLGYCLVNNIEFNIGRYVLTELAEKLGKKGSRNKDIYYARFLMIIINRICGNLDIDTDVTVHVCYTTLRTFSVLISKKYKNKGTIVLNEYLSSLVAAEVQDQDQAEPQTHAVHRKQKTTKHSSKILGTSSAASDSVVGTKRKAQIDPVVEGETSISTAGEGVQGNKPGEENTAQIPPIPKRAKNTARKRVIFSSTIITTPSAHTDTAHTDTAHTQSFFDDAQPHSSEHQPQLSIEASPILSKSPDNSPEETASYPFDDSMHLFSDFDLMETNSPREPKIMDTVEDSTSDSDNAPISTLYKNPHKRPTQVTAASHAVTTLVTSSLVHEEVVPSAATTHVMEIARPIYTEATSISTSLSLEKTNEVSVCLPMVLYKPIEVLPFHCTSSVQFQVAETQVAELSSLLATGTHHTPIGTPIYLSSSVFERIKEIEKEKEKESLANPCESQEKGEVAVALASHLGSEVSSTAVSEAEVTGSIPMDNPTVTAAQHTVTAVPISTPQQPPIISHTSPSSSPTPPPSKANQTTEDILKLYRSSEVTSSDNESAGSEHELYEVPSMLTEQLLQPDFNISFRNSKKVIRDSLLRLSDDLETPRSNAKVVNESLLCSMQHQLLLAIGMEKLDSDMKELKAEVLDVKADMKIIKSLLLSGRSPSNPAENNDAAKKGEKGDKDDREDKGQGSRGSQDPRGSDKGRNKEGNEEKRKRSDKDGNQESDQRTAVPESLQSLEVVLESSSDEGVKETPTPEPWSTAVSGNTAVTGSENTAVTTPQSTAVVKGSAEFIQWKGESSSGKVAHPYQVPGRKITRHWINEVVISQVKPKGKGIIFHKRTQISKEMALDMKAAKVLKANEDYEKLCTEAEKEGKPKPEKEKASLELAWKKSEETILNQRIEELALMKAQEQFSAEPVRSIPAQLSAKDLEKMQKSYQAREKLRTYLVMEEADALEIEQEIQVNHIYLSGPERQVLKDLKLRHMKRQKIAREAELAMIKKAMLEADKKVEELYKDTEARISDAAQILSVNRADPSAVTVAFPGPRIIRADDAVNKRRTAPSRKRTTRSTYQRGRLQTATRAPTPTPPPQKRQRLISAEEQESQFISSLVSIKGMVNRGNYSSLCKTLNGWEVMKHMDWFEERSLSQLRRIVGIISEATPVCLEFKKKIEAIIESRRPKENSWQISVSTTESGSLISFVDLDGTPYEYDWEKSKDSFTIQRLELLANILRTFRSKETAFMIQAINLEITNRKTIEERGEPIVLDIEENNQKSRQQGDKSGLGLPEQNLRDWLDQQSTSGWGSWN